MILLSWFTVIDCSEKMLPSVAKSLAIKSSQRRISKSQQKIFDEVYFNSKITEIARNADPKTFTSDYICCDNKF